MIQNILVPIDFSDVTDTVISEASRLARPSSARIWLVHVTDSNLHFVGYEFGLVPSRDSVAKELRHEHHMLDEYHGKLSQEGLQVTAMLVPGNPAEKILKEADRMNADLIILGSHGHGALHHLLMGSVCEGVIRQSRHLVVIVPSKGAVHDES